jgi:hypothetical protein
MSDRLSKLREIEELTLESLEEAPVDKRSPLIGQYRAILAEIAELEGARGGEVVESNGLIDFQAALAERRRATS